MKISKLQSFLRSIESQRFLHELQKSLGLQFQVVDEKGDVVFGTKNGNERFELKQQEEVIGYVLGPPPAHAISLMLNALIAKNNESRALAGETLEKYKELSLVYRLFKRLSYATEFKDIATVCCNEVSQLLNPSFMAFKYRPTSAKPFQNLGQFSNEKFTQLTGLEEFVYASGVSELVNDVGVDPRFLKPDAAIKSVICASLATQNRVLGVMTIVNAEGGREFTSSDLKLVNAIATIATIMIENVELSKEKSEHDRVKATLSRYVAPQIVESIVASEAMALFPLVKKEISVLFSDIRHFSVLCEKMPPEKLVADLNEYFLYLVDTIFQSRGMLDKYVGDGMLALFNAPSDLDDHALHAVDAAIRIQQCLKAMPNHWIRENFKTGIGINTGEAIIGNIGTPQRADYTAMGDAVNIAKRLEELAAPDQILVSSSVYEKTKDHFKFKKLDPFKIPGKTNLVDVYEVIYEN